MDAVAFLKFIWPAQAGYRYCVTGETVGVDGSKRFYNRFSQSPEQAAKQAAKIVGQGHDTYQCCAALKPGSTSRHTQNVAAVRALWLDLDVSRPGDGKANVYPDRASALAALTDFCVKAGLVRPNLVVNSGWGFHVYWVVDRDLSVTEWQPMAYALRNAAVTYGLHFDASVTTTLSRVLRTPGTRNFKDKLNPMPVEVVAHGPQIPVATLYHSLSPTLVATNAQPGAAMPVPQAGPALGGSDLSAGMEQLKRPSSMGRVVEQCPALQKMFLTGSDEASGCTERPFWLAMLMIAAHTDDGHKLVHAFSRNHPRLDVNEVNRQWTIACQRKQEGVGPGVCQTIAGDGRMAATCATCPHNGRITSPIQLSYDLRVALVQPTLPAAVATAHTPSAAPPAADATPPRNYQILPQGGIGGTFWDKDANSYVVTPILLGKVSRVERRIEDVRTNAGRMDGVVLYVHYHTSPHDHAGRTVRMVMNAMGLRNDTILAGLGVIVAAKRQKEAVEMFRAWSDELAQAAQQQADVRHFGWTEHAHHGHGFVLGDRIYWPGHVEELMTTLPGASVYTPKGDLQGWCRAAQAHLDVFSDALQTCVAASFAAPLVALSGRKGGRLLSICGDTSGTGKSTAMDLGQTVWGDPVAGTIRMNATTNAVPEFAKMLHSLPVFWDEARGVDQAQFTNLMFQVIEGRGRLRLNSNADLRAAAHWNNMVIVAANASTRDMAASFENTSGEGPRRARVFEVNVPSTLANRVPDLHLRSQEADANRGQAGRFYAQFLVANRGAIMEQINRLEMALIEKLRAPTQARFHISTMALLMTGAYLANISGLLRFDLDRIRDFLISEYRSMMDEGPVDERRPASSSVAAETLEAFLSEYSATTIVTMGQPVQKLLGRPSRLVQNIVRHPSRAAHLPIYVHFQLNNNLILIDQHEFNKWLVKHGKVKKVVVDAFAAVFGARLVQKALGLGTPYSRLRVWCLEIPLRHPELVELATSYASSNEGSATGWIPPEAVVPPPGEPVTVH